LEQAVVGQILVNLAETRTGGEITTGNASRIHRGEILAFNGIEVQVRYTVRCRQVAQQKFF